MKQSKNVSVSVVIPNWNGSSLLKKNLPSVLDACPGCDIIVADDASEDGSVAMLSEQFPDIRVVANKSRQGFAGNVNSGVAQAKGDIVVLLNTDVRPDRNFLAPLLTDFSDPAVAAVGCNEKSHEPDGIVMRGRGNARWDRGFFIHERGEVDRRDTAWVSGGSAAFRRNVWNTLGGMDTLYNPFYWEDIDLSYQILKAGYALRFNPESIVHHYHEEGKIKTSFTPFDVRVIVARNQFVFLWKNISDRALVRAHAVWLPVRLAQSVLRGDRAMTRGFIAASGMLPSIFKSRKRASRHWRRKDLQIFPSKYGKP